MHCGRPVGVADSCAGQKGTCPSCKAVITVPLADTGGFAAKQSAPMKSSDDTDDFAELENINVDAGGETDILPADTAQVQTGPFRVRRRRQREIKNKISAEQAAKHAKLVKRVRLFVVTFFITLFCLVAALAIRRWIIR